MVHARFEMANSKQGVSDERLLELRVTSEESEN
jgi:hypothetical protein